MLGHSRVLANAAYRQMIKQGMGPVYGEVVGRTRYFDDLLAARVADGLEQLVIMGAGFDTRAYRFHDLLRGARVFEVDHPSTRELKLERVAAALGSVPDDVVYVPADLDSEDPGEPLIDRGYDPGAVTLFILEGVIMYLQPDSVDRVLRFMARGSGPGSTIAFNYLDASVLKDESKFEGASQSREVLKRWGELPAFALAADEVHLFLSERGFDNVEQVTSRDLREKYFLPLGRGDKVASHLGIVSARNRLNATQGV
jgi:methyltransferase (TIGR00027 family)